MAPLPCGSWSPSCVSCHNEAGSASFLTLCSIFCFASLPLVPHSLRSEKCFEWKSSKGCPSGSYFCQYPLLRIGLFLWLSSGNRSPIFLFLYPGDPDGSELPLVPQLPGLTHYESAEATRAKVVTRSGFPSPSDRTLNLLLDCESLNLNSCFTHFIQFI